MGKKSGPPPPDYTGAATAQAQAQQENLTQQTWANRPTQNTPWGTSSWQATQATDPATGKPVTQWTQNTTLDPRLQGALDSQIALQGGRSDLANSMLGNLRGTYGQPMDWGQFGSMGSAPQATNTQSYNPFGYGVQQQNIDTSRQQGPNVNTALQQAPQLDTSRQQGPQLQTGLGDAGDIQRGLDYSGLQGVDKAADTRSRAEQAIYQSQASRLDPQWQQRQQDLETQLANRGITRNSAAFEREMQNFERGRADAYQQAQMGAIMGGGAEAQRDYGMDLGLRQQQAAEQGQLGQFANQAQQQQFNQGLAGFQFGNQAMGQQFGMDAQARAQQQAAQQAQFGMGQSALQQQLAAQQAGFGMDAQARAAQLAAQQQAFGQGLAGGQYGLQQQQQAFGQDIAANNQNFQQQMQMANYQNQLRQQQIAEALQQRGQGLNEMNALLSGQQVQAPQFQSFGQAGQAQAPDLLGAAQAQYQAALDRQSSRNAFGSDLLGAGTQIAGMFFNSDRRVKKDIQRIGRHPRGFGIYRFRYIGERGHRVGVIAQDVRRVAPELVRSVRGVLQVNYAAM